MNIETSSAKLRLPYIRKHYEEEIKEARINNVDPKDFLEILLNKELDLRLDNGTKNRIKRAKFPCQKTISEFNRSRYSSALQAELEHLTNLDFIQQKENVILIGTPGSGKTHFATALGLEACIAGKNVLFASVPDLVIQLQEAANDSAFTRYKHKFMLYDLIILDELGYVSFNKGESELLFNLLSTRHNQGSVIITTNLSFDRWTEVFGDSMVTSALVDRLAYRAHVLDMSCESSYRYEQTLKWKSDKA